MLRSFQEQLLHFLNNTILRDLAISSTFLTHPTSTNPPLKTPPDPRDTTLEILIWISIQMGAVMVGHGLEVGADSYQAGRVHLDLSRMGLDMEALVADMAIISSYRLT
jgi:hypothetical protein